MDWFVRAFLKASLAWLTLGVTAGVTLALYPPLIIYRTAHIHMVLLGFVAMMIFGVAYHVIPRFTGHPLRSRRMAEIHWWLANAGVTLLAAGFLLRPHVSRVGAPMIAAGGTLAAAGAYLFAYNLWRTIDGPARARSRMPLSPKGSNLPLLTRD